MNACIISIGNELLIGQTVNTNAAWMGEKLSEVGVRVQKVITIADDAAAIRSALDDALHSADLALVTGGLGPTHDDITKQVVTEYFGGKLIFHPDILERLRRAFAKRGIDMPAVNEGQAWLPDNARILPNKVGSAQGMLFEQNGKMCAVMPGVPREMKYIMENSVLPLLQERVSGTVILHRTWRTSGIAESALFEKLGRIEDLEAFGKLAFLPKYCGVDIRLTIAAADRDKAEQRLQAAEKILLDKVGKYIYANGDTPLEAVVGELLKSQKATLAVAESCTGGLICDRITNISGSSEYFMGGVIAYSNAEKTARLGVSPETLARHGAVSEETAKEMAAGVRRTTGTDFGLSTTGIAGPTGATPGKPVGLVYVGLASPQGVTAKRFVFGEDRLINKERSAYAALWMLYKALKERS